MTRKALLVASFLLAGCASTRSSALVVDDAPEARTSAPVVTLPTEPLPASDAAASATASTAEGEAFAATFDPTPYAPLVADGDLHASRFTVKAGWYGSNEDALDDGFIFGVSWMRFFTNIFAVELELGYIDADGTDNGVDTDVWALPIMLNGRANIPVWILDLYGGLGVGTFYYDIEADAGATSDSDDGFLLGGNAFLGATLNIAEAMALGLEAKYYVTDEISDVDTGLDAFALMLTLGWSR